MVYAITQFMPGSIEALTQRCLVDLKEKTVIARPTAGSGQIKCTMLHLRYKKLRSKILALALTTPRVQPMSLSGCSPLRFRYWRAMIA